MGQVNRGKINPVFRVAAYIDGFNLYFGMRSKGWRRFYWLNVWRLAESLLLPNQTLAFARYFTSRISRPPDQQRRQVAYLDALQTVPGVSMFFGHYLSSQRRCSACGHTDTLQTEKMTDVNIATELLVDAFRDRFDTAMLISADSDLTGPILKLRDFFPQKRLIVAFPPDRFSITLKRAAHVALHIESHHLAKSQFPDQIAKPDGYILRRPNEWR